MCFFKNSSLKMGPVERGTVEAKTLKLGTLELSPIKRGALELNVPLFPIL